jgi:hypothetical protein
MSPATATESDRRLLDWINLPADQRYETSRRMKDLVLSRLHRWAERVGATEDEVTRVVESLNLR